MKKLIVLLMIISLLGLCACNAQLNVDVSVDTNPSEATTDPVNETLPDWELPVDVDDDFTTNAEETTEDTDAEQGSGDPVETPIDTTQKPTESTQDPTDEETDPATTVAPTEPPTEAPTEAPVQVGTSSGGIELPWIPG